MAACSFEKYAMSKKVEDRQLKGNVR